MKRILVGMSGGIDSTWAVKSLISQGYEPEGVVLDMHSTSPVDKATLSARDLKIKLHVIDCRDIFSKTVEANLVKEYSKGRTPNPCVICNSDIKFKLIAQKARELGIDKISTGHYVRIDNTQNRARMFVPEDEKKDQSYFLWRVEQEDLKMFENVLSDNNKEKVKKDLELSGIAYEISESQEICFIPDGERIDFIKSRMTREEIEKAFSKGNFVDKHGNILGEHSGLIRYTPGQRKGLGIALGRPAYVLRLDSEKNEVVLGFEEDNVCTDFSVSNLSFVSIPEFIGEVECFVRVRHRGALHRAKAVVDKSRCRVELQTSEKTVSAGQSAVFYDESGMVLFGGFID